ncbi:MAG TPA: hypothetical protein VFV06_01805 [Sphingorhabdus sp.]|nr:hypothetical protein [Sphingorhabdus sp.]
MQLRLGWPSVIERTDGLQFCCRESLADSRWPLFLSKSAAGAFLAVKGDTLSVAWAGLQKRTDANTALQKPVLKLIPLIGTECVSNACCKMNIKCALRSWWALTGSNR